MRRAWSSGWKLSKSKHPLHTETFTDTSRGAERKEQGCGRRERALLHSLTAAIKHRHEASPERYYDKRRQPKDDNFSLCKSVSDTSSTLAIIT